MTDPFLTTDPSAPAVPLGPPIFGAREWEPDKVRYRRFGLEVEHGAERFTVYFETFPDIDGGALFQLMNARTQAQQGNAVAVLMSTQLRDDDGIPSDWQMPTEALIREDATDDDEDPWERTEDGRPLYERWDGEAVTADLLTFNEVEDGSSRRRFGFLMESTRHRVRFEALAELAEWLVKEAVSRPTRRSAHSRTGPQPTGRGAGARRR